MKLRQLISELEFGNIIPSKLPAGPGSANDKINQQLANIDKDTAQIQAQATANRKKTYTTPASKSYNDQMADLDGEEQAALDKLSKTSARPITGNKLFENKHKATAAFCFGRFNPPHQGHMEVWNAVKHAGHKWFIGTNPGTIGPNDPLPYELKTAWMTAIDPQIKGHILGEQSVVTLAAKIYQQVGDGATIAYVTDSQDWAWAGKLLHQYNGKESNHGYFNFANIIHVESPRVSSATALRTAARAGDMKAFYQAAGTDPNLAVNGQHYYDTVVAAVGQHPEKIKKEPKAKKEKPVAEPVAVDENSIKYVNRIIREMRAQEFMRKQLEEDVPYAGKGAEKLHHNHVQALKNAVSIPNISMNKSNGSPYMQYRFGIAMANPGQTPSAGAMSGDPLISAYTDADMEKIKAAAKATGAGGITHISDGISNEADGGNKISPVAKLKKNKYGI